MFSVSFEKVSFGPSLFWTQSLLDLVSFGFSLFWEKYLLGQVSFGLSLFWTKSLLTRSLLEKTLSTGHHFDSLSHIWVTRNNLSTYHSDKHICLQTDWSIVIIQYPYTIRKNKLHGHHNHMQGYCFSFLHAPGQFSILKSVLFLCAAEFFWLKNQSSLQLS